MQLWPSQQAGLDFNILVLSEIHESINLHNNGFYRGLVFFPPLCVILLFLQPKFNINRVKHMTLV